MEEAIIRYDEETAKKYADVPSFTQHILSSNKMEDYYKEHHYHLRDFLAYIRQIDND
jgi:hypothetical protein